MDSHEPDFIVVGEKVALGPLRRDLAADYARWMNEPEVRCGLNQMGIATPQSQEKWVEENLERGARREPEVVEFTVYDREDSAPVGTAGLLGILHAHGNAEFAIFLGERRGQGLGTEATRLVLDFAFHVLQLRNVLLETLEWNAAGLAAYQRAGFRRIGAREHRLTLSTHQSRASSARDCRAGTVSIVGERTLATRQRPDEHAWMVEMRETAAATVKVLSVDDHAVFRRALDHLIAFTQGFEEVGQAASGAEALELARALGPDLVLLDVRMDGMDGLETARRLTASWPGPVVVLISLDELPQGALALACGAAAHVRKQDLSPRTLRELWSAHGAGGSSSEPRAGSDLSFDTRA